MAEETTITIEHLDLLLRATDAYPHVAGVELERAAGSSLLSLIPDLAHYPAPPRDSTYRRTGTLGRLWTSAEPEFSAMASGFEASIGNPTPYGPYVQDLDMQAPVHRERWQTTQGVTAQHETAINRRFADALERITAQLEQMGQST